MYTEDRKYIIGGIVILVSMALVFQLINLQLFQKKYKRYAVKNSLKKVVSQPARGLIYDRNGKIIVYNQAIYDLYVTPYMVTKFDTTLLSDILNISVEDIHTRLISFRKKSGYTYTSYRLYKQLTNKQLGSFSEQLHKFKGFSIKKKIGRGYNYNSASHVIGYLREVNKSEIQENSYYQAGDIIGNNGIEKYYENILRGEKGVQYFLKNNRIKIIGKYEDGKYDIIPKPGRNITLTLDMELQRYGEYLMQNKRGAIVAIEPKTGEILAKISTPFYNLDNFSKRDNYSYFNELLNDDRKPLFDRTLFALYQPGSIFKIANALVALQEGKVNISNQTICYGYYNRGKFRIKCRDHIANVNLDDAITFSCNSYFVKLFINMLYQKGKLPSELFVNWHKHILSLGFAKRLSFNYERSGFIPNSNYYNNVFKSKRWHPLNIISLAIGQGELLQTPLQMANFAAIIANKGYYIEPHIIKKFKDENLTDWKKHYSTIESHHFEYILNTMKNAVNFGTGNKAKIPGIQVCGKTGTIEIKDETHADFIGIAPYENPKIAILVYIENGGSGGDLPARIAGLMIDKYLNKKDYSSRKKIERYISQKVVQ